MQNIQPRFLPTTPGTLKTPAVVSTVLVVPFIILELVNRHGFSKDFPIPLFGFMWLLALAFTVILMPILRSLPAGSRNTLTPAGLFLRTILLIAIAWVWVSLVIDQMPCFLGVPNCD